MDRNAIKKLKFLPSLPFGILLVADLTGFAILLLFLSRSKIKNFVYVWYMKLNFYQKSPSSTDKLLQIE